VSFTSFAKKVGNIVKNVFSRTKRQFYISAAAFSGYLRNVQQDGAGYTVELQQQFCHDFTWELP
jgi:hypothetical protein